MKTLQITIGLILLLSSCSDNQKVRKPEKLFDVSYRTFITDTTIDSKKFLDNPPHIEQEFYGNLFLEDSLYQIYGCCAGEFGGSLFFYNKTNHKLFFYPSMCVDQVISYHNSYYVAEDFGYSDFIQIKYPEKLIELKYKNRLLGCNWWVTVDSLKKYYSGNWDTSFTGLIRYKNIGTKHCVGSFVINDTLFTIASTDSSTYLEIHQGDSLHQVQKLLNKKLWFHRTLFYEEKGKMMITFSASSTQWNTETKVSTDMANTGLITIQARKIDIAEHLTSRNYIHE